MNIKYLILSLAILTILSACNSSENSESNESSETNTQKKEETKRPRGISIEPLSPDSPKFPDAKLSFTRSDVEDGKVDFDFEVENYELGVQTSDAADKGLANSGKGQHIHFIDNNGPYSAHYEADFTKELEPGNHVILAFLSRSYHESVKSEGAAVITQVPVGEEIPDPIDLTKPIMFYSRPKGTYKGADTKNILLDFYLHNVDLSIDGYRVKATINNNEFTLTKWMPYIIKGAPMGELKVKLELIDPEGNLVEAPYNPVERTVILEE